MIEITCFYIHFNREPVNFTFIKYEKFMKIFFQSKKIIIAIENLRNYHLLFQFYILSLLCTENSKEISTISNSRGDKVYYGVSTHKYWKNFYFANYYDIILFEEKQTKNPFHSQEPKRETSIKKIRKFLKSLNHMYERQHIQNPLNYIQDFQSTMIEETNIDEIIEYEKKIEILSCIRSFNKDIYSTIQKFI